MGVVVFAAIALIAGVADTVKHAPNRLVHKYSRADLRADAGKFRAIARQRAHGVVRGPTVRRSGDYFLLTYRRGRRCRVVLNVLSAPRYLGGGGYGVTADGCR